MIGPEINAKAIPITDDGQLVQEAGMLVFGYMMHPNCERSARQFARVLSEETYAKAGGGSYQQSSISEAILDFPLINRLLLCGHVAHRVCTSYVQSGAADLTKASHIVSELNATNRTMDGKSLPTDKDRLRKTFLVYRPTIHFWAAAYCSHSLEDGRSINGLESLNEALVSPEFLGIFLAMAKHFEEILAKAKPSKFIWSAAKTGFEIWDFNQLPKMSPLPETEIAKSALASYRTRPKY